jgi:hypothetical protein
VISRLKKEFYSQSLSTADDERLEAVRQSLPADQQRLDPAFEISRFVVWPLYPVHLGPSSSEIVLDDRFHFETLVPFDARALSRKAEEWGEVIPEAVQCNWELCEWTDHRDGAQRCGRDRVAHPPGNAPAGWATFERQESGKLGSVVRFVALRQVTQLSGNVCRAAAARATMALPMPGERSSDCAGVRSRQQ